MVYMLSKAPSLCLLQTCNERDKMLEGACYSGRLPREWDQVATTAIVIIVFVCLLHEGLILLSLLGKLLLNLLKVEAEGRAELSEPVVLLGPNLRLHTVFLRAELHVKLRFSLPEVDLLLGHCDSQPLLLNEKGVHVTLQFRTTLPFFIDQLPNLAQLVFIHFLLSPTGHGR